MDDIITSIKAFLYDRTTSPLFGSVLLSWSAWNWEVILVLFSDKNFDDTVKYISQHFSTAGWTLEGVEIPNLYIGGMLFPLLVAAAYIYLYPRISLPVLQYSLTRQNEAKAAKILANRKKPITEEEANELHIKIAKLEQENEAERTNYRKQISALMEELENKGPSLSGEAQVRSKDDSFGESGSSDQDENKSEELKSYMDSDMELLVDLYDTSPAGAASHDWIREKTGKPTSEVYKTVKRLSDSGLLKSHVPHGASAANIYITPEGREVLASSGLID